MVGIERKGEEEEGRGVRTAWSNGTGIERDDYEEDRFNREFCHTRLLPPCLKLNASHPCNPHISLLTSRHCFAVRPTLPSPPILAGPRKEIWLRQRAGD